MSTDPAPASDDLRATLEQLRRIVSDDEEGEAEVPQVVIERLGLLRSTAMLSTWTAGRSGALVCLRAGDFSVHREAAEVLSVIVETIDKLWPTVPLASSGFADRLREARERKDLTTKRLGQMAGISQPTVTSYEQRRSKPDIETAERLARALGEDVCWLVFGLKTSQGQELRAMVMLERVLAELRQG